MSARGSVRGSLAPGSRRVPGPSERGQTTLDFAVGAGVFLLTIAFVLVFVPTMFDPFAGGTGADLATVDRIADQLAGDLLAVSTADPGAASTGCTVAFFENDTSLADGDCSFEEAPLGETLGLDSRNADVTVHALGDGPDQPAEIEWEGSNRTLTRQDAAVSDDVTSAARVIRLDGTQYRLTVRVW